MVSADALFGTIDLKPAQARLMEKFADLTATRGYVTQQHAGIVLLGDLLLRHGLTLEQACCIIGEIKDDVGVYFEHPDDLLWILQICDGVYATWSGNRQPYDFNTATYLTTPPPLPIASTAISLTGLWKRIIEPLETA